MKTMTVPSMRRAKPTIKAGHLSDFIEAAFYGFSGAVSA
jgi:hypothetical protein